MRTVLFVVSVWLAMTAHNSWAACDDRLKEKLVRANLSPEQMLIVCDSGEAETTPVHSATPDTHSRATLQGKQSPAINESHTESSLSSSGNSENSCESSLPSTLLEERWDTHHVCKMGAIKTHDLNYFIMRHTNSVNDMPNSPSKDHAVFSPEGSEPNELKFQISAKTKLVNKILGSDIDWWAAYTQQSNWQVFNNQNSRPFRNSNYEPDLFMFVKSNPVSSIPSLKFVNFSLWNHQSNGQGNPKSRSWNRSYVQFGFDVTNQLSLLVRPWWRWPEKQKDDDNTDIKEYMGNGDISMSYKVDQKYAINLLMRNNLNFSRNRGAFQLDAGINLFGKKFGNQETLLHLQLFNGYGESLIDYNYHQTTIGIGLSVAN